MDISDYSIEIIALEGTVAKPKLSVLGREILEPGIIEDGKIIEKEKLKISLKNLIANPKFGKIKTKKFISIALLAAHVLSVQPKYFAT